MAPTPEPENLPSPSHPSSCAALRPHSSARPGLNIREACRGEHPVLSPPLAAWAAPGQAVA